MDNKIFFDYEDLEDLESFSVVELNEIKKIIEEVMISKKEEKISWPSSSFWINIFPNGNLLLTNKITGRLMKKSD
jgi:hypothetical protein